MKKELRYMTPAIALLMAFGLQAQTVVPYAIQGGAVLKDADGNEINVIHHEGATYPLDLNNSIVFKELANGKMNYVLHYEDGHTVKGTSAETDGSFLHFLYRDSRFLNTPYVTFSQSGSTGNLSLHPVKGASGYSLRVYRIVETSDGLAEAFEFQKDVEADVTTDKQAIAIPAMEYNSQYVLKIRSVSADGEEFSSPWLFRSSPHIFGYDYWITATETKNTPEVLRLAGRGEDNLTVSFNLVPNANDNFDLDKDADGNYKADKIVVKPYLKTIGDDGKVVDESIEYPLSATDKAAGTYKLTGLKPGVRYDIDIVNSDAPCYPDGTYNTITTSTLRPATDPILVPFNADNAELNACNLGIVLQDYFDGKTEYGNNQVFYLQGDKNYFIPENISVNSGFTLATDPADIDAGKRAKILMGDGTNTSNFMLGSINTSFSDMNVTMKDIDLDVPGAMNAATSLGGSITGNYLVNCLSRSEAVEIESLTIKNCTFRHLVRGFVRIQGNSDIKIKKMEVDGNLFYECGYHASTGSSYAWFASDGKANHNIFENLIFTNNTIYNSPMVNLVTDGNKAYNTTGIKWNIKVENNTFVNFNILRNSNYMFNLRYLPETCHISFQRNLLVITLDPQDSLDPVMAGADVRTPGDNFSFEFKDNYSVGYKDKHMTDDGIFTTGAFSSTKYSFGKFAENNLGTADDLKVKVGTTPLKATELFAAPTPPYTLYNGVVDYSAAPDNIFEALKYQDTPAVRAHEIYTKNVGDPRWRF